MTREQPTPTPTPWIDPDEVPELTDEFFERADVWNGDVLIKPGKPNRDRDQKNSI